MNIHTTMLLAAAGASSYDQNTWIPVQHALMDSTLPWQDPDGVFVSLVTSGATWTPILDYNGAGGVNDGFAEMVAWKADIGALIPARTGQDWSNTLFAEFVSRLSAIPSDSAAWQPHAAVGCMANATTANALGVGCRSPTATQSGCTAVEATASASSSVTTGAPNAGKGAVWRTLPPTGTVVSSLRKNDGTVVVTTGTTRSVLTALTVTSSQFVVGFGNGVNNPAAGNRTITVDFFTRVFTLPFLDLAAVNDATGWTPFSPLDCGNPSTPASNPNAFGLSFDASAPPEWRPTIDDTGIGGPFDGYDEGIRWDAVTAPVSADQPFFVSFEYLADSAYAATQQFGFAAGISDIGTGSTMPGYKYITAAATRQANAVQFNTNTTGTSMAGGLGCSGLSWPSTDGTTTASLIGASINLTSAGLPTGVPAVGSRANALVAPVFSVAFGKDTSFAGSTSVALPFNVWTATIPGYTNDWPP